MNSMTLFNPALASDLFDAMERNFNPMLPLFAENSARAAFLPKVDVLEKKDLYLLEMDLPGFTEKDVEISLKENLLTISSVKMAESKTEKAEGEYILKERSSKQFLRRFTLPNDIDNEKVSACFKNGVLSISIPRKEAAQKRTISITTENA